MAYYLAVERQPNSYEAINIRNTRKGRTILEETNNNSYECTLEEIDKFTTQYDSLQVLKYDLYSEHKISWFTCPLAIVYKNEDELKITKDILLSSSKEYIENPSQVLEHLINTFCILDTTFAKELLATLPKSNRTKTMLENLVDLMEESIEYNIPLDVTTATHLA